MCQTAKCFVAIFRLHTTLILLNTVFQSPNLLNVLEPFQKSTMVPFWPVMPFSQMSICLMFQCLIKPQTSIIFSNLLIVRRYFQTPPKYHVAKYHFPSSQSAKCLGVFKLHTDTILATVILQTVNQLNILEPFSKPT